MSFLALVWALEQRGIKTASKVVLIQLCNRYNPKFGCFPSKDTLARDCEMSVRSVYDQIKILEKARLLKVVPQSFDTARGAFTSNAYILGCDPNFIELETAAKKSTVGKFVQDPSANSRDYDHLNLPTKSVTKSVKRTPPNPHKSSRKSTSRYGLPESVKKSLQDLTNDV